MNIGDKLYYRNRYSGHPVYAGEVVRVTNTQAIVKKPGIETPIRLKREYSGSMYAFGDTDPWSRTAFYLLTPEIEKEIEHDNFRGKHAAVILKWENRNLAEALRKLPDDALVKISEIISNLPV